jgi:uncharacterized protein HemY
MARGEWGQAEVLADEAWRVLRKAGIEESFATPLVCAAHARVALHRGDVPAARQQLVSAQRQRPLLTYALWIKEVPLRTASALQAHRDD